MLRVKQIPDFCVVRSYPEIQTLRSYSDTIGYVENKRGLTHRDSHQHFNGRDIRKALAPTPDPVSSVTETEWGVVVRFREN